MNRIDDAKLAWRAQDLLHDLQQLLWDRYGEQFNEFLTQDLDPNDPLLMVNKEDASP